MYSVTKTVEGTDGRGGVWTVFDPDGGTDVLAEVDISYNRDGSRNFRFTRNGTVRDGTVPMGDDRSDDELACDVVFTNGSAVVPSFRPAR